MTRAEYLEFIEEQLCFPDTGVGNPNPSTILYDHADMIQALHAAHTDYCRKVAAILAIDREYQEAGGPEDRPDTHGLSAKAWIEQQERAENRMKAVAPEIFVPECSPELPLPSKFREAEIAADLDSEGGSAD